MKRNRKLAVVICICLILSLCLPFSFQAAKKKIDSEMSVYYLNEDRTGLVKAPYETGKTVAKGKKMTDKEIYGMAEDILKRFRKPSIKSKNVPPIPNEYLYKM